jgi:hypothetical protein
MDLGPYLSTLGFNHEVGALVELPVTGGGCLACRIRKKVFVPLPRFNILLIFIYSGDNTALS